MTLCRSTCTLIGTDLPPLRAVSCLTKSDILFLANLVSDCLLHNSTASVTGAKRMFTFMVKQMLRTFFKGKDEVDRTPSRGNGSENLQLGLCLLVQGMKTTILHIHLPPWPAPQGHHALCISYLPTSKQHLMYIPQQSQMRPQTHCFNNLPYQQELPA